MKDEVGLNLTKGFKIPEKKKYENNRLVAAQRDVGREIYWQVK